MGHHHGHSPTRERREGDDGEEEEEEDDYESLPGASVSVSMAAGACAGVLEHSVMFPFDAIKTRMQILTPSSPQAAYSSLSQALSRILTTEGFRSLWRGVSSVVLGAGPAHAIYFSVYEKAKEAKIGSAFLESAVGKDGARHAGHAMAGICAVVAHDAFMNPFDVVKQRMQLYGSNFRSPFSCFFHIFRNEGLRALYISYPTTLAMSIPFQSVQFTTYEHCKAWFNPEGGYNPASHVFAGAVAGGTASLLTNPLDVTKTLLQTRGTSSDPAIRACSGFFPAVRLIFERDGLKGFARGIKPRILSHMPSTAVSWGIYELFKYVLHGREQALARESSMGSASSNIPPSLVDDKRMLTRA